MLSVGDVVEDFELPDENNVTVRLSDLLADGPAVVYFYVRAKTPG